MTTQTLIHGATKVTTDGVSYDNSNAITLKVSTDSHWGTLEHKVTLFDLPKHIADALEGLLGSGGVKLMLNEAAIRADERRRINKSIDDLGFPAVSGTITGVYDF
jgi:hypothetical protein